MIPGVVRGVIASSFVRPSDLLKAPNSFSTDANIPPVGAVSQERSVSEFYMEARFGPNVSQHAMPLNISASVVAIVKKVA